MSSMLEQAIVDAAALRDAALKNAEAAIIEKYAPEIKSAVETLLEQAPMDDDPMDDPLAMDMEPAPDAAEDIVDIDVPLGGLDDEDGRPPSGEQIEIELSFDDLKDMAAELAPPGDEQESHAEVADELDIVSEELEEVTKIVESDDEEDIVLDEQAIAALVEELVVDISPQKGGWAGTPESVMQHNEELALAQAAATEAREENEALRKAVEELSESNTNLKKSNKTLKETVLKMKSTFDEVSTSNAKLIYTNRILSSPSLNERQKEKIVEAINKAGSVDEAKVIYETLQSTGGTSRRRQMPKSLSETIKRSSTTVLPRRQPERTTDTAIDRLQILAGIKHNKN